MRNMLIENYSRGVSLEGKGKAVIPTNKVNNETQLELDNTIICEKNRDKLSYQSKKTSASVTKSPPLYQYFYTIALKIVWSSRKVILTRPFSGQNLLMTSCLNTTLF